MINYTTSEYYLNNQGIPWQLDFVKSNFSYSFISSSLAQHYYFLLLSFSYLQHIEFHQEYFFLNLYIYPNTDPVDLIHVGLRIKRTKLKIKEKLLELGLAKDKKELHKKRKKKSDGCKYLFLFLFYSLFFFLYASNVCSIHYPISIVSYTFSFSNFPSISFSTFSVL